MSDYANGADGSCQECGADTDEEWHALCMTCWRAEQGWDTDKRDPEPVDEDLDQLDRVAPALERCPSCGELHVLMPSTSGRMCLGCRDHDQRGAA